MPYSLAMVARSLCGPMERLRLGDSFLSEEGFSLAMGVLSKPVVCRIFSLPPLQIFQPPWAGEENGSLILTTSRSLVGQLIEILRLLLPPLHLLVMVQNLVLIRLQEL